jgi:hypothetical protein
MPTDIELLLAFEGPNLYSPRPGVLLRVRSDKDRTLRLKAALKDGAQSIGMVLAYLDVSSRPDADGYVISANFTTPTPNIGVELARYVVAGLNARETGDDDWDAEGPLWDLQKRRRAEALPLPALQLTAEAASRGVPAFVRRDGMLQLGYGARSWALAAAGPKTSAGTLEPDDIGLGPPPFARAAGAADVPWERIGPIPIVAVTGGAGRDVAAELIARALAAHGQAVRLATAAGFDATQALLADQSATIAIAALEGGDLAARGLAFERCAYSAIVGLPSDMPPGIADRAELARVLGVPMLVADPQGAVALDADTPEVARLGEYAPGPVIYTSTLDENPIVGFHRAAGGQALFVRDGTLIAAHGPSEQALVAMTSSAEALRGVLASLSLLWAMGLAWEQIISATLGASGAAT